MMRTWTLRALVALAAFAVAAPVLRAASPEMPVTTDEKLNKILEELADLNTRLSLIKANQIAQRDEVDRLRVEVDRLNDDVRRLSKATTTTAASINPEAPVSPLVSANIVMENRYNAPATVVLNNQNYVVLPGQRVSVPATVGRFTYAVYTDDFGLVQPPTNRFLTPGRDFPIVIHP